MAPPSGPVTAGLEAVAVAAGLMWLGYGLTGLVPAWRGEPVTRWALAFPAVVVLALGFMAVHVASGGAFFQNPRVARTTTALVALALALRWLWGRPWRRRARRWLGPDFLLAVASSLLAAAVWGSPLFRMLPVSVPGDTGMHAAWTEQLLNGEIAPSGPLTGAIPNYYPWLFHAVLALLTLLTPGDHAYLAYAPLQLLQVAGVAAALFGIGHHYRGRLAGSAFALLGAAAGGWGFFVFGGDHIVPNPRADDGAAATHYLGDLLLVRSYNASFMNLAPPFPRDLALALLAAAVFVLVRAAGSGRRFELVAAGFLLGLVGLTQTDAFVVGGLAVVFFAVLAPAGRRWRTGALVLAPAAAVFSLWALPIAYWYFRLGGFVNTTEVGPVVLPAWAILGGWGIVTPLAAAGTARAVRIRSDPLVRVVGALLAAALVVVAVSIASSAAFKGGFETLGRQHRYWPLVGLALALLAGIGATWLVGLARTRSRVGAWALAALIAGLALPSPILATIAMPSAKKTNASLTASLEGARGEVLNALSDYGDGACSALAPESLQARWAYTGFRLLALSGDPGRPNAARIRWANIYEHIVPQQERARDYALVIDGTATKEQFRRIVARYSLDVVVVPARNADAPAFQGLTGTRAHSNGRDYVLFGLSPC